LQPTDQQKKILLQWFESCRLMFNKTIRLIKERSFNKEKMILSFKTLRTYMLKEEKNKLIALYNTPSHILDGAIKLACASYKSAMSNLKQKNIRHFNVRYLKATKRSFIMDLEQCYFNKHSICPTKLGNLFKNKDDIAYDTIKSDCKIHYNTLTKRFTLLIPQKHDPKIRPESNDYVSVDPGVRTFLTCISNNPTTNSGKIMEIGTNASQIIRNNLERIDRINNNKYLSNKRKKIAERKTSNKIINQVTDLHWKSINELTKHNNIMIGNWSTKNCISNKNSKLFRMTKRVASRLRYYEFLMKLKYKCELNGNNLKVVDESYTSILCSSCGNEHPNLGSSKVYKCIHCNLKIDRDVNSCRGIAIKSQVPKYVKKLI